MESWRRTGRDELMNAFYSLFIYLGRKVTKNCTLRVVGEWLWYHYQILIILFSGVGRIAIADAIESAIMNVWRNVPLSRLPCYFCLFLFLFSKFLSSQLGYQNISKELTVFWAISLVIGQTQTPTKVKNWQVSWR